MIIRECTQEEKDNLLAFLIGHWLASNNTPRMLLTPELVTQSMIRGKLPIYDADNSMYMLKMF